MTTPTWATDAHSRRRRLSCVLLVALFATLTSTSPANAAGEPTRLNFKNMYASAIWSTCPEWPQPPGTACTEMLIVAAETVRQEDGVKSPEAWLSFHQGRYHFDDAGDVVRDSERFGVAETKLSIDKRLTYATASATVQIVDCAPFVFEGDCVDAGTVEISASWTGQGDIQQVNRHIAAPTTSSVFINRYQRLSRPAEVTASVDGDTDFGTLLYGELENIRDGYMSLQKPHPG